MGKIVCWSIIIVIMISLILTDLLGVGDEKTHRKDQFMYKQFYERKKYINFDKITGYIYCDGEE